MKHPTTISAALISKLLFLKFVCCTISTKLYCDRNYLVDGLKKSYWHPHSGKALEGTCRTPRQSGDGHGHGRRLGKNNVSRSVCGSYTWNILSRKIHGGIRNIRYKTRLGGPFHRCTIAPKNILSRVLCVYVLPVSRVPVFWRGYLTYLRGYLRCTRDILPLANLLQSRVFQQTDGI